MKKLVIKVVFLFMDEYYNNVKISGYASNFDHIYSFIDEFYATCERRCYN